MGPNVTESNKTEYKVTEPKEITEEPLSDTQTFLLQ